MGFRRKLDWSVAQRDMRRDRADQTAVVPAEVLDRLRSLPNPVPQAEIAKLNSFVVARLMRHGYLTPSPGEKGFRFNPEPHKE